MLTGSQMNVTCKTVLAFLCTVGLTGRLSAADYVCSGILIDQRVVGVSLGNCEQAPSSASTYALRVALI
jgi:hypothetical protein